MRGDIPWVTYFVYTTSCTILTSAALLQVNAHVVSILEAQAASRPHLARQQQPGISAAAQVSGVSAFAFQGTNAHAILVQSGTTARVSEAFQQQYSRRRLWFSSHVPHALASRAVPVSRSCVQLECSLQLARLSYLWDHRVGGRALLPAAAMLEAASAGASCMTAAMPACSAAISHASITARLVLPEPKAAMASLICSVDAISGTVSLASADRGRSMTSHLTGTVSMVHQRALSVAFAQQQRCKGHILFSLLSAHWSARTASSVPPPASIADIAQPPQLQPDQYHMHPAAIDCTTQAGAAFSSSAAAVTRVPAGIAAYVTSGQPAASSAGTAIALLTGLDASGTATADHRFAHSDNAGAAMDIAGMQFKVISSSISTNSIAAAQPVPSAEEQDCLYEVEWQASHTAEPELTTQPSSRASISWRPQGGKHSVIPSELNIANALGRGLQCLQQHLAGSQSKTLQLQTRTATAGLHGNALQPAHQQIAAAGSAALLRVAAQEYASARLQHVNISPQLASTASVPQPPSSCDAFGMLVSSACWQMPSLQHITAQRTEPPTQTASRGVLITGGAGEIGTLIALHASHMQSQSGNMQHIQLTGQTGWRMHPALMSVNSQLHMVSSVRSDVSSSEDVHMLAMQLRLECPAGSIAHCSGAVEDAALPRQTAVSLRCVLAPKSAAALALQRASWACTLTQQTLFSSLSALLGTAGQSNYAAANAMLNTLSQQQQDAGAVDMHAMVSMLFTGSYHTIS